MIICFMAFASCGGPFNSHRGNGGNDTDSTSRLSGQSDTASALLPIQKDTSIRTIAYGEKDSIMNDQQGKINLLQSRCDSLSQRIQDLEDTQCFFSKSGIWGYVILFILILILSPLSVKLWSYIFKKNPEEEEKEFRDDVKQAMAPDLYNIAQAINDNRNALLDRIRSCYNDLNSQLYALRSKITEENTDTRSTTQSEVSTPNSPRSATNKQQTFYLLAPKNMDRFDDNRQPYSEEALYKFSIDLQNPNKATFEFIGRPGTGGMTKALNSRQEIIEFACEPKNAPLENTRACKPYNGSKGEAVLQNGEWVVIKRQMVIYE